MAWKRSKEAARIKKSQIVLALALFIVLVIISLFFWRFYNKSNNEVPSTTNSTNDSTAVQLENETTEPSFDSVAIQNVLDTWASSLRGTASVVVKDTSGNVLAEHNPDQVYFAASIYKLYTAYFGYQQLDAGAIDPNEIYINGHTRAECLDLMIRESDSPCAEKLWAELGKQNLTDQLVEMGIDNTSMTAISTTSADASKMLVLIATGKGLSDESQAAYLSSMKEQDALYRRGLPSGFSNVAVYNKVGWNEQKEWHDTAIVELSDGRKLIVSVFTENAGSANVARLGTAIQNAVSQ